MTDKINMRPATQNDYSFGYYIKKETLKKYIEKTYGWNTKYQNKGIGSTILTEIINTGKNKMKSIILQVLKSNTKAVELYRKLGFNEYAQTDTHIKLKIDMY